jgi:UDP-GlcNAc:undecaprenyl-phosphate/decaprenyl-phosphate GlcNAc-1-phosphate transferase
VTYLTQALLAALFTALLVLWLRRPAERFGLVDHPGGRKRHSDIVPLTGGLAITVGFFAALSLSFEALAAYKVLFVATATLAAIGLLDDLGEISARSKLLVQVLAAVLMTSWGNHFLTSLGDLFGRGPFDLANWAIPLTVFATVAVINGINMIDGMDGLAGGLVAVMLAFFALFAFWLGEANALKIMMVLIGAVLGFLVFNAPHPWRGRRRVFMGDTGSLVLGLMVTWFTIELTQERAVGVPPVVMLWVVGLVLFDVFTVTVRRLLQRRDPIEPDRAHVHHVLQRCGMSMVQTWLVLLACNALLGAIGTIGWRAGVPEHVLFAAFVLTGAAYFAVFFRPGRLLRWWGQRRRRG